MNESVELTAIILTKNEAEHIVACIESLQWVDRIVVFDSYSDDGTVALAEKAGAEIGRAVFENYAQQRNAALDSIETDWVLFIDADERTSAEVATEVRHVINHRSENGWSFPRHNYLFGKLTLGAGWWPDYQARLFRHGSVRYERPVHELAVVEGNSGNLEHPLVHYNYKDVAHFKWKQDKYSTYDASILYQEGIRPRWFTPFSMAIRQFKWRYIELDGYKIGRHGLHLSLYMAYYEWVKYRKLQKLFH